MITLTAEERRKFSEWLKQEARCNKRLIEQLGISRFDDQVVVKAMRNDIVAFMYVAAILDNTEDVTICDQ